MRWAKYVSNITYLNSSKLFFRPPNSEPLCLFQDGGFACCQLFTRDNSLQTCEILIIMRLDGLPKFLHASLMHCTSACAVGSFVEVTILWPCPTIFPFLTITQPKGPPFFFKPSSAYSIACFIKLSWSDILFLRFWGNAYIRILAVLEVRGGGGPTTKKIMPPGKT